MLTELRITGLGVIDEIEVVFGSGLTALTGETGAGKTMVIGAVELLLGGRSDPSIVRPGSAEAVVEGRSRERSRGLLSGRGSSSQSMTS